MSADPAIRVHAIMLGVTDIERSKAFYTEKLGFALQGAFGDFAFVDAGGTMLVLSAQLARTGRAARRSRSRSCSESTA